MRQIADELGINKASLYYYYASKEAIVQALFEQRGDEAEELVSWLRRQVREPGLLEAAVLRWVESFATEKLQGIRFMAAIVPRPGSAPDHRRRAGHPSATSRHRRRHHLHQP